MSAWKKMSVHISAFLDLMTMNYFCGMVDRQKAFSLISSQDNCQRSSPSRISNTPWAGFEPAQNLHSGFLEWSCAVVITTRPQCHKYISQIYLLEKGQNKAHQNYHWWPLRWFPLQHFFLWRIYSYRTKISVNFVDVCSKTTLCILLSA